ncbi:hypothetical protein GcM1_087004, partial [Golovinomyces cichoracearum]
VAEYFLVYRNPGYVVGVYALRYDNEQVTCSRNAFKPLAPVPTKSLLHTNVVITGFQCGQDEINNELLLSKLIFTARLRNRGSDHYEPFPEPIPRLEGPNFMWLLDDKEDSTSREEREARNSIYLITDKYGSFVQVSFMLLNGKNARCNVKTIPNTNFPTLRTNNPIKIRMGYICDVFFDDDLILQYAIDARKKPWVHQFIRSSNTWVPK